MFKLVILIGLFPAGSTKEANESWPSMTSCKPWNFANLSELFWDLNDYLRDWWQQPEKAVDKLYVFP
jgi:hypothetical protein